jgi:putative acetyltransferase
LIPDHPEPEPPYLRPARDDDSWDVIGLIGACWSEYPGCVMDVHGECPDLLAPASAYRGLGGAFWVATDPCETVVATVGWRPLPSGAVELERLYVHRRWRRRGLAATLADLVEGTAAERRADAIELWSDSRFADAHRFYERRGYARGRPDRELGDLSHTREHHFVKVLPAGEHVT